MNLIIRVIGEIEPELRQEDFLFHTSPWWQN